MIETEHGKDKAERMRAYYDANGETCMVEGDSLKQLSQALAEMGYEGWYVRAYYPYDAANGLALAGYVKAHDYYS